MNYRTVADLNAHILAGLPLLPRPIDLVVGIPRSGLLAGSLLALHLNCALTDPKGLLEDRIIDYGSRGGCRRLRHVAEARGVIVLDDSIYSGKQMESVRGFVRRASETLKMYFGAVYTTSEAMSKVDFWFNECPLPRVFEWNLMHYDFYLANACLDLDGVLCCDPTEEQNDDGPRYLEFLRTAKPFLLPTVPVGYIVTCRLEKYRRHTEDWLREHEVRHQGLIMMHYASQKARLRAGNHGIFKAEACKRVRGTSFIESEWDQAIEIARRAGVDVFCTQSRSFITPTIVHTINRVLTRKFSSLRSVAHAVLRKTGLTPSRARS